MVSWVREEAMRTLYLLIKLVAESHIYETWADVMGSEAKFYERFVSELLQQLAEKIDRVREVAGRQL